MMLNQVQYDKAANSKNQVNSLLAYNIRYIIIGRNDMRFMMFRFILLITGLTTMITMCNEVVVIAAPSAQLQITLGKTLPVEEEKEELRLPEQVQRLLSRANRSDANKKLIIGIEYDDSQPGWKNTFKVKTGKMREQLDTIASNTGYIWQAEGDAIYFIPKKKLNDPKYPLNQVIEGDIVLSRSSSVATPMKSWFAQHGFSFIRDVHQLRLAGYTKVPGPDPIVLHNPTLREYTNAHERLYGNNIWTIRFKTSPAENGEKMQHITFINWGQSNLPQPDGERAN